MDELLGTLDLSCDMQRPDDHTASDMIVWLEPESSRDVIETVQLHSDRDDRVISSIYVELTQIYHEFQEYYADQPHIVDLVEPDQLPTRLDVVVQENLRQGDLTDLIDQLNAIDGVSGVDIGYRLKYGVDLMQLLDDACRTHQEVSRSRARFRARPPPAAGGAP